MTQKIKKQKNKQTKEDKIQIPIYNPIADTIIVSYEIPILSFKKSCIIANDIKNDITTTILTGLSDIKVSKFTDGIKERACIKLTISAKFLAKDYFLGMLYNNYKQIKDFIYNMLFTLVHTGMRRGEIVALMWKNVDFNNNVINVRYSEYKGKLVTPKSATSYRSIKMPSVLRNVLLNQKLKTGDCKFVFPNALGGMYMANNVNRRMFKPVVRASNLGELRLHDIRHTYGSQLIENGAYIKYVQAQMGHASVNVTLNIYTHYYIESEDKALTILENLYTT